MSECLKSGPKDCMLFEQVKGEERVVETVVCTGKGMKKEQVPGDGHFNQL